MGLKIAGRSAAGFRASKRRKRRTAAEIRGRLLNAAREEFNAKGFTGATTAAIAKRADVAEIQMFRYFPSKADLFHEAIFAPLSDHFRTFVAKLGPGTLDEAHIMKRARLYISELLAFLSEHSKMLVSLIVAQTYEGSAPATSQASAGSLQAFLDEIAALMAERVGVASEIEPETMGRVAFGALLGCITYRDLLFPHAAANSATIDQAIAEFILAGIGPYSDVGPARQAAKRPKKRRRTASTTARGAS